MVKRNFVGEDDRPFNSSLAYLERVERRWEDCDLAKVEGNTLRYFRVLETIYRNTHPFFSSVPSSYAAGLDRELDLGVPVDSTVFSERGVVEALIYRIEELFTNNPGNRRDRLDNEWVAENLCDKLRMLLVRLLFKYKITYYSVEGMTWQEEVERDFS